MHLRRMLLVLALVMAGALAAPAGAQGIFGRYRDCRYFPGRGGEDIRLRGVLRDRLFFLGDRANDAARSGALNRWEADRVFDRLDRVRDFLRDDRFLTRDEFERRMDDLDDVEQILRRNSGWGRGVGRGRDWRDRDWRDRDWRDRDWRDRDWRRR